MASLPEEIFGHVGGNTTCVEIEGAGDDILLIDAGTGIREAGLYHEKNNTRGKHYHILLTHFHWDHLQGLPFFSGFFQAHNRVTLYSVIPGFETVVRAQMAEPNFPVPLSIFPAKVRFVELGPGTLDLGPLRVTWKQVNHPGTCVSYRIDHRGKTFIFSTDTELRPQDFEKTPDNLAFFQGADVLVLDAQYTLLEALDRAEWGHSSSSIGVDFGLEFGIRTLYLFHHEPTHDDAKIHEIGRLAQWYADHKGIGKLTVRIAREGRTEEML